MTRDDVIRMAREAGDDVEHTLPSDLDFLERFAALVAAKERTEFARHFDVPMDRAVKAEREACAVICDELHNQWQWGADDPHSGPADCAAAIRARGES